MSLFEGRQSEKPRKRPQATMKDGPADPSRRAALRKIVGAVSAGILGAGALDAGIALENMLKPQQKKGPAKIKEETETSGAEQLREVPQHFESKDVLSEYTFLTTETHPKPIATGGLAGEKFSTLYASYLGIPDGSVVPEILHTDFKANLAALWREKFSFDVPGRSPEQEHTFRTKFLAEHHDLMDLAERLYRSYNPAQAQQMPLGEYTEEIEGVIKEAHTKFMGAMYALRDDEDFPEPRRALIEKMVNRIGSDTLLACSLTELMPSAHGETNAAVLDFLLQHAGADFLYRIPSIHDLLPSFGPYQITPALFGSNGVGSLPEKMEKHLPKGFMPKSVYEVSGKGHHLVAYIAAAEHIVQFVGQLHSRETERVQSLFNHTPLELLHREVAVFTATAHHQPTAAYHAFGSFIEHTPRPTPYADTMVHLLDHIHDRGLQQYAHKALANYDFLSTPGARANIANVVS